MFKEAIGEFISYNEDLNLSYGPLNTYFDGLKCTEFIEREILSSRSTPGYVIFSVLPLILRVNINTIHHVTGEATEFPSILEEFRWVAGNVLDLHSQTIHLLVTENISFNLLYSTTQITPQLLSLDAKIFLKLQQQSSIPKREEPSSKPIDNSLQDVSLRIIFIAVNKGERICVGN